MPTKVHRVGGLNAGLATTRPPTDIPEGALRVADNVSVTDGQLRSAPGYKRVTKSLFDDHAYKLDGLTQYFRGRVDATDTNIALQSSAGDAFTIEVTFKLDTLPADLIDDASFPTAMSMIAFKGPESDIGRSPGTKTSSDLNWYIAAFTEGDGGNAGKVNTRFFFNWSGTPATVDDQTDLVIGEWYHAVAVTDGTDINFYVHKVGEALGSASTDSTNHSSDQVVTTTNDLVVGASPVTKDGTATVVSGSSFVQVEGLTYSLTSGTWTKQPKVGSSVLVAGLGTAGNNGVKRVVESTDSSFKVAYDEGITDESHGSSATITEYHGEARRVQYGLNGTVQELRIWDDERTTTELFDDHEAQYTDAEATAETNLVYYQRLTGGGSDTYFFASQKGTAGSGSSQSPLLSLMPRDATWRDTGHTLGDPETVSPTIDLDGSVQGFTIPDAYQYRTPTADDEGKIPWPDNFGVTMKVTPRTVVDRQVLFEIVPALSDDWTIHWLSETTESSTFADLTAGAVGNLSVEVLDTASNDFQVRAVLYHRTGGGTVYATSEESSISGGLVAGTEYTITVGVDTVNRKLRVYVLPAGGSQNTNTSSDWQQDICSGLSVTAAAAGKTYTSAGWAITPSNGDRIFWSGFTNDENNGWKTVESATGTVITVKEVLVNEGPVSVSATLETTVPSVAKGEYQATRKYAAEIGRSILRTQQINTAPGDPAGVNVDLDLSRSFDGEIRQVAIAVPPHAWSMESLHSFVSEQDLTLGNVSRVGLGIVSAWLMTDGRGESIEDAASGNNLEFQEDPDHVWSRSGLTTASKVTTSGLLDHRYTTPSGDVAKMIAIAGGTLYEVDADTGTTTFFADGFRNDDDNIVSSMKYQDSQILCCGRGARGNFHLWRDQLWRLDIKAPEGEIPFGLTDQKNKEASLQPGTYMVLLTFYSAYTGKESPIGPVIGFEILKNRANLALGNVAEINQTYPSTGTSINKDPFDLEPTTNSDKTGLRCAAWVGVAEDDAIPSGSPAWWQSDPDTASTDPLTLERVAKVKRVIFSKKNSSGDETPNTLIEDTEDVTAEEVEAAVEASIPRVFADVDPLGFITLKGAFSGSGSFLRVKDLQTAADPDMISAASGAIGFTGVSGSPLTNLFRGSGDFGHGGVLPVSNDPQVTHVRMYRTLANDETFRLAEQVPNGTLGFVHYTPDTSLVGPELDITVGPPPAVEHVSSYGDRAVYVGDPDNPDFVYFSPVGEPWNVPAENVIRMADGDSLPLTGVGRTEGALMLFKDDTTFLLRPPVSPLAPFSIETRLRDIGCVAARSVVNIHDKIYFAGERGLYSYDSAYPEYLSHGIEPTWLNDVSVANRNLISAVHDRENSSWVVSYPSGDTLVGGSVVNDRALVLDYEVGRGDDGTRYGWTNRTNLAARFWKVVPDANDVDRVFFVDHLGYISRWASGTDYGPAGLTTTTLTASAGGSTSVTVPQATLAAYPDGHKGFWVTLVRAADSSRESRLVTADSLASPSALTIDHAWTGDNPVSGDTVLIGSVESEAIFGDISPFGPVYVALLRWIFLRASLQATSGQYRFEWQGLGGVNNTFQEQEPSFSTVVSQDGAAISNQKVDMKFAARGRGRRMTFRVLGLGPDLPFALREFSFVVDSEPEGYGDTLSLT